ncbi:MAG: hypothetical protein GX660_28625 [Clostridiaceae bacterium]|nr:hypothetical protein [Clostridiaceae bacterium]
MEMCYDGDLVMPKNYVAVDNDEMEYIEGGVTFSRSWIAVAVDVIALAVAPYLAPIKFLGKNLAKALVSKFLPQLAGVFRTMIQMVAGVAINMTNGALGNLLFGNVWCLTSVGGMVGLAADYFSDGKVDGTVRV